MPAPKCARRWTRASQFLQAGRGAGGAAGAVAVALSARRSPSRRLDACALLRVLGLSAAAASPAPTRWSFVAGRAARRPARRSRWAIWCMHRSSYGCWPAWSRATCRRRAPGRACSASASACRCCWPSGCRRCCSWRAGAAAAGAAPRPGRAAGRPRWAVLGAGIAGLRRPADGGWRPTRSWAASRSAASRGVGGCSRAAWLAVRLLRRVVPEVGAPRWLALATASSPPARAGGAAGQRAGRGPDGADAAGAAAHRPGRSWRAATPADAPDRFVINIQPDQAAAFRPRWASRPA